MGTNRCINRMNRDAKRSYAFYRHCLWDAFSVVQPVLDVEKPFECVPRTSRLRARLRCVFDDWYFISLDGEVLAARLQYGGGNIDNNTA